MTKKTPRARYPLEFKKAAVRLVGGCQRIAAVARSRGPDAVQLGQGSSRGQALRGGQQGRERRANGDQPAAGRTGAREDGARHSGKSDGVLRKGSEVKYAFIQRRRVRTFPSFTLT